MTQDELKTKLSYDPTSGMFYWVSGVPSTMIGKRAGTTDISGYRRIGINNKTYLEHRLVWLYAHGYFPTHCIDHINGVKDDNRIRNLREATNTENMENRQKQRNNTSGFIGVTWNKSKKKWQSQLMKHGKNYFLGYFNEPEIAHEAYLKAKSEYHQFQPIPFQDN